jgi:hypothetical protein
MHDASRVERLWLAMAVAMVWLVGLGAQAESQSPSACPEKLSELHIARTHLKQAEASAPARCLSCAQRGRLVLLAALLHAEELPIGKLLPEEWPETLVSPRKFLSPSQKRQKERQREHKRRQKKAASSRKKAA